MAERRRNLIKKAQELAKHVNNKDFSRRTMVSKRNCRFFTVEAGNYPALEKKKMKISGTILL